MARLKKILLNNDLMTETMDDELDVETDSQVEKFSTDYTADKLNELYNEFDSITLDNSAIDTITKRNAQVESISARARLYLTAGFVVVALLLFLMVYNFFVINNMSSSIDILQGDLTYQEYQVMDKARQVEALTDDAVIRQQLESMGYAEVSSESVITITNNANSYVPLQGETNWFDALCEFVGSIFGG
jgi:hypothetical protein